MKISELNNSISTLSGVGSAKTSLFARLNVYTISDLLQFYPRDYEDRTQKVTIAQSLQKKSGKIHTIAEIIGHEWFGYGRMKTLKLIASDGTGIMELVAFNRPFMEKTHPVGQIAALTAKAEIKYGKLQSTNFELEKIASSGDIRDFKENEVPNSKVLPIYPLTEGLTSKNISKIISLAYKQYSLGLENDLPAEIIEKKHLLQKRDAIRAIHFPKTMSEAIGARNTLAFEELFLFQRVIAQRAMENRGCLPKIELTGEESRQRQVPEEEFLSKLSTRQQELVKKLPYKLTPDQMSVITMMNEDIDRNYGFSSEKKGGDRKSTRLNSSHT